MRAVWPEWWGSCLASGSVSGELGRFGLRFVERVEFVVEVEHVRARGDRLRFRERQDAGVDAAVDAPAPGDVLEAAEGPAADGAALATGAGKKSG